ncbi:cytochrome C [Arcobacteraceae bacterium]|nr:cytochrome C [Arcobacteraceae bacterium]
MKLYLLLFIFVLNLEANNYKSLLFHGNCTTCHFEHKAVSAPSITELKKQYLSAFPNRNDFVDYMSRWVQHPNPQTSLMNNAIKKYELMPELGFDLDTLKKISEYIYDTDFTQAHENHQ